MAEAHDLTVYDAAYLRLAEARDGVLVTDDDRLHHAGESVLGSGRTYDAEGAWAALDDGRI